jgi:uncharacterized damage-inducible protein DinB
MTIRTIALCAALALTLVAGAWKEARAGETDAPKGFRGEFLSQIEKVEEQILGLEGAVPQEKFDWRPAAGVRSIGEVYLHIAFANYFMLQLAGYEPPADVDLAANQKKWDSQTSEKKKIAAMIRRSFDHVRTVVAKIPDADLEKTVNLFGTDMSLRSALMVSMSHLHEHLGQSIAYARSNGVVPPWSEAQQKAEEGQTKK